MKSARLQVAPAAPALPAPEREAPWQPGRLCGGTWERPGDGIDSVQWVDLPAPRAVELATIEREYFRWVPRLSVDLVKARSSGEHLSLGIEPFHWPRAIRMAPAKEADGVREREILGGMLAYPGGLLGFELHPYPAGQRLVVAVRGLNPRLPRWVYFIVQARMHERSTFAFLRQARFALATAEADRIPPHDGA